MESDFPNVQFVEGRFARVRVRTQDAIVLEAHSKLTDEQIETITATLRSVFPGNRLLILDEGMRITAFGRVEDDDDYSDEDDS